MTTTSVSRQFPVFFILLSLQAEGMYVAIGTQKEGLMFDKEQKRTLNENKWEFKNNKCDLHH
ncbi:hypothetical protein PEC302110_02080 [Pectobacterium araliae]|uniref:Uncharacterized protein n=1 Tax=Pectobacterium araliae TaxID=3073862 RepID=A0AAN0KC69_9GAMM|nr:hypothetical protein PEC302110_02080 [Pectobacterium sp. MAFF 302110]